MNTSDFAIQNDDMKFVKKLNKMRKQNLIISPIENLNGQETE